MADPAIDRPLPHNLEAERAVLGAILLNAEAIHQAVEFIKDTDFFRDAHRRIFEKMLGLMERGQAIDFITIKDELARSGELDQVGGPAYVASLVDGLPHGVNVGDYARIVKQKSTLRSLIQSANRVLSSAYHAEEDAAVILDEAEREIFAIAEGSVHGGFVSMRELANASFAMVEQAHARKQLITGVPTGFLELDEMLAGLQRSDLIIVAARPVDGQDEPRAQHRAARRDQDRHDRRVLQPRDVEGAAVPAHADVRGRHRRPPAADRVPRRTRLSEAHHRARDARPRATSSSTTPPRSACSRCARRPGA